MKKLLYGYYGTRIYLPFSGLSRRWRRFSKRLSGKDSNFLQQITLPAIHWKQASSKRFVKIWEHNQANGNIRISELGIINALAATCEDNTNLFEIGTFDGRTTINLAFSSPSNCNIYTLDLPQEIETRFLLEPGEKYMVDKQKPGARYDKYKSINRDIFAKIHQLLGDSATFDFSPYEKSCSLVFVDGSHAYEYAISDTKAAMRMVKKEGIIVWHDYGIWKGITKALEDIEEIKRYGLKNIKGTSLVYWKNE